jgi:pyruvate kinase
VLSEAKHPCAGFLADAWNDKKERAERHRPCHAERSEASILDSLLALGMTEKGARHDCAEFGHVPTYPVEILRWYYFPIVNFFSAHHLKSLLVMKFKKRDLKWMLSEIEALLERAKSFEKEYKSYLKAVHPSNLVSAKNLVHYLALRASDMRALQQRLSLYGLSSLGRSERHVQATLLTVRAVLRTLLDGKTRRTLYPAISVREGKAALKVHTTALLGKKQRGSRLAVMVTLPTDAAHDPSLTSDLISAGMTCARINCAHDDEATWLQMIQHIRTAEAHLGLTCKICMDLAGPKLRTGPMKQGERVLHLSPERDLYGRVIAPALVYLSPPISPLPPDTLPLPPDWLALLQPDDRLTFIDTRGKLGTLKVEQHTNTLWLAKCYDSAYFATGTTFTHERTQRTASVLALPPREEKITLRTGDRLILHKAPLPGEPAEYSSDGTCLKAAHLSCTLPQIFGHVQVGDPILFDDGAIEGVVQQASADELLIEITHTAGATGTLRSDKGINLPQSHLPFSGLTEKDDTDLRFIAKHADLVSASFIQTPDDVQHLLDALHRLHATHLGLILKIETHRAFQHLPQILLTAMRHAPLGVMIARGDLALEVGWENLASVQEELLRLGEAAHIPIIWATQVLETLAKKGRPSRAEISDVALAERAEAVMLNKGAHILDTIQMLERIVQSMQRYQEKKTALLPALQALLEEPLSPHE